MCAIFRNGRAIKDKGDNSQFRPMFEPRSKRYGARGGLKSGVKGALRGPGEKIRAKEEINRFVPVFCWRPALSIFRMLMYSAIRKQAAAA